MDVFGFLYGFLGPGGFGNGPGVDSDSFGPSFSPNGPFWIHLGSIFDFQFFGNPYGVPFWAQPALTGTHGGRRPTFWRPKADAGGSGGEAPSKMGPFGALLGTPVWKILSRLVGAYNCVCFGHESKTRCMVLETPAVGMLSSQARFVLLFNGFFFVRRLMRLQYTWYT